MLKFAGKLSCLLNRSILDEVAVFRALQQCSRSLKRGFKNSVCVYMCLVGRGWEGNATGTGKQPARLSSIPETNLLQWEYGASVLYGATGKQRYSKVKQQGEHLSKEVDVTCCLANEEKRACPFCKCDGYSHADQ